VSLFHFVHRSSRATLWSTPPARLQMPLGQVVCKLCHSNIGIFYARQEEKILLGRTLCKSITLACRTVSLSGACRSAMVRCRGSATQACGSAAKALPPVAIARTRQDSDI